MRLKAPFYAFALGAVAFLLPLVVFAALLPLLVNADPVKERFVEELRDWTGSEVELLGPVAIESFFSLSFNAQNVEFKGFEGHPRLKSLKAGRIVARIAWTDLLFGNLDFDKIKIYDSKIRLNEASDEQTISALLTALIGPYETPFAAFVLSESEISIARAGKEPRLIGVRSLIVNLRRSAQRIDLRGSITVDGEQVAVDMTAYPSSASTANQFRRFSFEVDSRLLSAAFDGEAKVSGVWGAKGDLRVSTPNANVLSRWLGGFEPGLSIPLEIAGALEFSGERIQLQTASVTAGAAQASGEFTVGLTSAAKQLEGSLAFDELNLSEIRSWNILDLPEGVHGNSPFVEALHAASVDLRVSAQRVVWDRLVAGSTAFTLGGRGGRISAEIAHLDVLGGSILGHVEVDLRGDMPLMRARITAENVDASKVMTAFSQEDWLAGQADANVQGQAEGRTLEQLLRSATMNARVNFPDGGQVRLDFARLAESASAQGHEGWREDDFSWVDFSDLRFELALEENKLRCLNLNLISPSGNVRGTGDVDLSHQNLDWQLAVHSASELGGEQERRFAVPEASLSIKGPWGRPLIRLSGNSSGMQQGRNVDPYATVAGTD